MLLRLCLRLFVPGVLLALAGCAALPRHPVPPEAMDRATIPGVSAVRATPGIERYNAEFAADFTALAQRELAQLGAGKTRKPVEVDILALSGGGDYGAFGAGVLVGWSKSGKRPSFKIVTGISTGALMATFAFLGVDYDATLREAYTTISADDIYRRRTISALWSEALTDSAPLAELIARFVDDKTIAAVAAAHRAGRRLYIGTTNLDADELVVWNMGAIADSGRTRLFRQIILASASIPGVFPPVLVGVEADGHRYDEMHVDGGVKAQLFLLSTILDVEQLRRKLQPQLDLPLQIHVYAIRNAKTGAEHKAVERNLVTISNRALSSLLRTQGVNDLLRAYQLSQENGFAFSWIAIPSDYSSEVEDEFDRAEMNRLFRLGFGLGGREDAWRSSPPSPTRDE